MKYIFLILCCLLIFYNFETTTLLNLNKNSHVIAIWKIAPEIYLLYILPHNVRILLDNDEIYLYLKNKEEQTYVSALNLRTNFEVNIVNYMYLREWSDFFPKIIHYSNSSNDILDILNSI